MQSEQQDSILQGHLPECPTTTDPHGLDDGYACPCECQCEILRACEQRVRMEDDDYAYVAAQAEADGRWRGWVEALDAAREAVAAIGDDCNCYEDLGIRADALAAIDALWDQPADQTGYKAPNVRHLAADLIEEYAEARHQPHTPRYDCGRCDLTAALRAAAHDIRNSS